MEPVEISAGRLHLRPWQESDEDAVYEACQDPEIQRWTRVPSPYTREDAREHTLRSQQGWQEGGAARFAVLDATSGGLLGTVLLFDIADGDAEVGYWCAPWARGQGVMSEAVATVCRWGFGELGLARIEWAAGVGNWASLAVAQKCGFTFESTSRMGLVTRGERHDGWWAALLATDEMVDRRPPRPPTLTDGVVTLRPWSLADAPEVARACDDPETARWLPVPSPYAVSDAETWISSTFNGWAFGDPLSLAVTDASTGAVLGSVALSEGSWRSGRISVGYWTAPWGRGRGAASRATTLLTAWAFAVLGVDRVELLADVDNAASQRVAEKAGFHREGTAKSARRDRSGAPRDFVQFSRVRSSTEGGPLPG
ncbi:MAG: family N-acetyltransferase [Frankiales bacterium]|nr:family N-acetyltransferase [Frankiales bacterium]